MFRIDISSFQIKVGLASLLLVPLILLSGCTDDEPQILLGMTSDDVYNDLAYLFDHAT
jgi:hypothetical protein